VPQSDDQLAATPPSVFAVLGANAARAEGEGAAAEQQQHASMHHGGSFAQYMGTKVSKLREQVRVGLLVACKLRT
jgi:hypothetical protein